MWYCGTSLHVGYMVVDQSGQALTGSKTTPLANIGVGDMTSRYALSVLVTD